MKVDNSKLKKGGSSELTPECRQLIKDITKCRTRAEILQFLENVQVWVFGKCELYHWIEILDRFDKVLEEAARHVDGNEFVLHCDTTFSAEDIRLLLLVLNFTTLLIEHSFSRHLYNSIEHLTQLLSSHNMDIVLAVLNLLYMFSKRSNFIPRLSFEKKELLLIKLFNIAERWGDPNYGLALIDCCMKKPKLEFLYQFLIEYIDENGHAALLEIPDMMDLCKKHSSSDVVRILCKQMSNPSEAIKTRIAHRVRLVSGFKDHKLRLQFVQARLQAVSVLIYSNALQDNIDRVLYPGFGEELCELIDKEDTHLVEIRAAVLRTLTSMLHFDRNPNVPKPGSRLPKIIQYTGAERQSGILPMLVRDCIASLTGNGPSEKYPLILATSLFSLLYHLASYEAGGHALVKSGMMQSLLRVISWPGVGLEHITFVTRAVRVIDLITNIDIAKFHQNNGLNVFIDRLEREINYCREIISDLGYTVTDGNIDESNLYNPNHGSGLGNQNFQNEGLDADDTMSDENNATMNPSHNDVAGISGNGTDADIILLEQEHSSTHRSNTTAASVNIPTGNDLLQFSLSDRNERVLYPANSYYSLPLNERNTKSSSSQAMTSTKKLACVTQRAALLKSMLNFLKKSIQDHANFNGMRNVMETSLPCSLRHIISNAEFYGPSLFLLATDVVTVYVFNEPSLLSSLQDSGLTNVILQSLLQKEVPATREVLGSLPNVFSALCLNERGLMEFMSYEPFDKLLKVLLSPDYLVAMRRRRSSDPLGDTATNLGNAMDDLMKHHPYLRTDATQAIVRLLNELVRLGSDPNFICWRANKESTPTASGANSINNVGNGAANGANQNNPQQNPISTAVVNMEQSNNENENDSSGDDDDDDDEMSSASQQQQQRQTRTGSANAQPIQSRENAQYQEREAIPLIDYILNVMKFIEAIFNNSSNGEHCREFVLRDGLKPLLQLLSLPNLPVDSPVSTTAQAVANVCKSILNLAHDTKVIDTALQQLSQIVGDLKPLIKQFSFPGTSVLLKELISCPKLDEGFSIADYTPLLHSMSSVHGYVVMLVHLCRSASNEMRLILLKRWGANRPTGLQLLRNLVKLYISLVWESTILLGLCSDENADFDWDEMVTTELQQQQSSTANSTATNQEQSNNLTDENVNTSEMGNDGNKKQEKSSGKPKVKSEDQLRYIKSLLAASSRLGRALAELFGTLVKLSVGTPQSRQRRGNDFVNALANNRSTNQDAKEIARVLSSILVNSFSSEEAQPVPAPKLKLTFLICSVGFTGPMLFDDKRSSFHLMISQFCEENGLKAFFDMFYWAIGLGSTTSSKTGQSFSFERCMRMETPLENSEDDSMPFPESTGEFLDAWLQLLEKMVNPRAILESPYSIAQSRPVATGANAANNPGTNNSDIVQFEPVFYLLQIHQLALQSIRRIWKRKPIANYGLSMTETLMTIMKHLIRSYGMLSDRFQARVNELQNAASKNDEQAKKTGAQSEEANINQSDFKMLMDMGFLRSQAVEALQNTRSLEQATDYLLANSAANAAARESGDSLLTDLSQAGSTEMDVDIDSTGGDGANDGPSTSMKSEKKPTPVKFDYTQMKIIPIEIFREFCAESLERAFAFMEHLPETVNTAAELIELLYRCNNSIEKQRFVESLVENISSCAECALHTLICWNTTSQLDMIEDLFGGVFSNKLLVRLRISTMLLDEMYMDIRKEFCAATAQEEFLGLLISLLKKTEETLRGLTQCTEKTIATPRWLRNLIELIDAIDNVSTILQRKSNMRAVCSDNWKWYDTSTGKWNSYNEANNNTIKHAFHSGERSVAINIGRQRYTINFNCMTQVSEASGNHRPVLPSLKISEAIHSNNSNGSNSSSKVDTVITKTIRSKPGESGKTIATEETLCLHSLLNSTPEAASNNSGEQTSDTNINASEKADRDTNTATTASDNNVEATNIAAPASESTDNQTPIAEGATALVTDNTVTAIGTSTPQSTATGATKKMPKLKPLTPKSIATKKTSGFAQKNTQKIVLHEETVGVARFDTTDIIACLVRLLQPDFLKNFETKLAVLKLCARLTKDYENAEAFAKAGGINVLLSTRQSCGLMGFPTFAIVIIRHILEAPPVLQEAIERALSARASPSVGVGHRDLIYVLTQVSSAVARHPATFLEAAKQTLRAEFFPSLTMEESRLLVKSRKNASAAFPPTQLQQQSKPGQPQDDQHSSADQSVQKKDTANANEVQTATKVIKELLRAIVQPCIHYGGVPIEDCQFYQESDMPMAANSTEGQPVQGNVSASQSPSKATTSLSSTSNKKTSSTQPCPPDKFEPCCCSWHIPSSGHVHQKPILPRSTLIKVLADAVRSYQSLVPKTIVDHIYTPADSILIEKEQTCLAFLLDNFLPIVRRQQDSEVSMMTRVLIASLSDCYSQTGIQTKVIEEWHEAIVRALSQPESSEKHIRLQVLIGLLPAMVDSPMLTTKFSAQRNYMYRIMLRQGIMAELVKIAQYKDLSNPHTLATISSVLRPMEILLRLTVSSGPASRRLFFGTTPQGASIVTRRHFPRLSRTIQNTSLSSGGENVWRDIIRNVISDRRHVFDFFLNTDDIFIDSDEGTSTSAAALLASNDDGDDTDIERQHSRNSSSQPDRAALNFDRLWDDLMQDDNIRMINRTTAQFNTTSGSTATNNATAGNEHHRHRNSGNGGDGGGVGEDDNHEGSGVGGGSDGASTSSEIPGTGGENRASILVDVSTTSDSDSNVSTENDERNADDDDDDEEDDEEEVHEGNEDRSETDADEETRQYIEVYDHMYEAESSETASNDADVDADDEASETGGAGGESALENVEVNNMDSNVASAIVGVNTETSSLETHMLSEEDHQEPQSSLMASGQADVITTQSSETNNSAAVGEISHSFASMNSHAVNTADLANNSVRTTPTTVWVAPRVALAGNELQLSFRPSTYAEAVAFTGTIRNENGNAMNSQLMNVNNTQRRESSRRLVFLDQQYCAAMPSHSNPTEEGQIDLFNQDSLHWWFEEAKYLDLESQTDACLYVAHHLVPHLIKDLKTAQARRIKLNESSSGIDANGGSSANAATSSTARRSAIPVLIQQSSSSPASISSQNTGSTTILRRSDMSQHVLPSDGSQGDSPQVRTVFTRSSLMSDFDTGDDHDHSHRSMFDGGSSEDEHQAISDTNEDDIDDDDDEDEDDEDNYEDDDDDIDDEEVNPAFIEEEEELNSTFDLDFTNSSSHTANMNNTSESVVAANNLVATSSSHQPIASSSDSGQQTVPLNATVASASEQSAAPAERDFAEASSAISQQSSNSNTVQNVTVPMTSQTNNETPAAPTSELPNNAMDVIPTTASSDSTGAEQNTTGLEVATPAADNATVTSGAAASTNANVVDMSPEVRAALGDLEVPEGVDPSFLAALPSEMREEVIQEHLRMQRIRQRAQQNAIQVSQESLLEVNPEFLAALPPSIQSEVLMQQRIEQQRQAAQSANPEDPVDAAAFFQNLPDSLRQAILTDMEESQIASLPPDLAAEAQLLRRDWESRNGARLESAQPNTLGGLLSARFHSTLQNLNDDSRWHNSIWYDSNGVPQPQQHQHTTIVHQQPINGKPVALILMENENNLLDPDALSTLLLFLFIEDPKINFSRLQRVIRNLCYHAPTRDWIINALISIIQKTNNCKDQYLIRSAIKPQWLKLKVDAAFGYKSDVFIISSDRQARGTKVNDQQIQYTVSINPQAAQMIVRNCLDMLFVLAKHFASSFVPYNNDNKPASKTGPQQSTTQQQQRTQGSNSNPDTITSAPMTVAIASGSGADNDLSPEELLALFHRPGRLIRARNIEDFSRPTISNSASSTVADNTKLDDAPSTSRAAAVRNQKINSTTGNAKNKLPKGVQYNTNSNNFWDVLLNIDLQTQKRMTHMQSFPISSQPAWEWENKNSDFQAFNDSPFARLLEMLPYKVICRSPQLTDMLVKLLASLSNDLPKEDETSEPPSTAANTSDTTAPTPAASSNDNLNSVFSPLPNDRQTVREGQQDEASNTTASATNSSETQRPDPTTRVVPDEEMTLESEKVATQQSQQNALNALRPRRKMYSKNFSQLQIVIQVLTHQCGTTDGLDNISKLIVNLSQCSQASNAIFLQYLSSAIMGLAQEVRHAIQDLLNEIRTYNKSMAAAVGAAPTSSSANAGPSTSSGIRMATPLGGASSSVSGLTVNQGIMQDRFTSQSVIISAPTNIKPTCELQLPAMKKLLSSSSAQPYFLRTLKIFIQVRELFEAQEQASNMNNTNGNTVNANKPTLSQIICLDDLWNTLSECLVALEESKDEYAVLVLQPTVEAFFLIHASQKKNKVATRTQNNSRITASSAAAAVSSLLGSLSASSAAATTASSAASTTQAVPDASASNSTSPSSSEQPPQQGSEQQSAVRSDVVDPNNLNQVPSAPPASGMGIETVPAPTAQENESASSTSANSENISEETKTQSAATSPSTSSAPNDTQLSMDRQKFLSFAEKHRTVLNQILRQSPMHLSDGPFAVLVDHTRILDFDVKRKYFQTELERLDEGVRREENTVSVRRVTVFEDSFRALYRLGPEEWKNRFYIVFEDEEGQDAGGLLREWYVIISREIFNPMYALFCVSPGDRVTYMINPSSHANPNHLSYFKFVGRVIAKAVHDNKLLECYFTRSFYKHILGKQVKHTDMESQDYEFYKGLDYLMKNDISTLGYELTFSTEVQEFGVTQVRDLIPNGRNIAVNEENKFEYVQLVCQLKMSGSIRQQLDAFLEGFYDIIPKHLISIFNEQELELLISGLPDIDIEDLKANTEYHKYTSKSIQIQWFWRALRSFDQADRAKFLQFVTGTSKVPLQGFGSLEGMNGIQKFQIHRDDRSTDRLPCAHTCFNQLDLPMYKSYEKLRGCLLKAIHECSEGFGFA